MLGISIDDNQGWKEHYLGKKGLINSLYSIKRISNQIPKSIISQLVQSLWMSKVRYGIQLCTRVRCYKEDTKTKKMKEAQLAQNKLLRFLDNFFFFPLTNVSVLE